MGSAFSDELLKQVDETMRKRFEEAHKDDASPLWDECMEHGKIVSNPGKMVWITPQWKAGQ